MESIGVNFIKPNFTFAAKIVSETKKKLCDDHAHRLFHIYLLFFSLFSVPLRSRNEEASLHCNIYLLAARLIFEIRNDTAGDVKIQFIGVFNDTLQFGKLNPSEFPLTIKQGMKIH